MMEKKLSNVRTAVTPSQELAGAAQNDITITDARGRSIRLKKPNVLAQFRLVKMLGDAARGTYMSMVTPLTYVVEIDGEPVTPPRTERELDALIQELDEEGVLAVIEGIQANFSHASQEAQEQELKNS